MSFSVAPAPVLRWADELAHGQVVIDQQHARDGNVAHASSVQPCPATATVTILRYSTPRDQRAAEIEFGQTAGAVRLPLPIPAGVR